MKVMGIDQSYTSCGVVIWNTNLNTMSYFTTIHTSPEDGHMIMRANIIIEQLAAIARDNHVDLAIIEGLSFGQMIGNATRDLAGLQYLIYSKLNIAWDGPSVDVNIVSPTSVKKIATGGGKADKNAMIDSLPGDIIESFTAAGYKKSTGLKDLADAYWISKSYMLPDTLTAPKIKKPKKKAKKNDI